MYVAQRLHYGESEFSIVNVITFHIFIHSGFMDLL